MTRDTDGRGSAGSGDGWTVQILPDDGGSARSLRVTRRHVRWGAIAAAVLAAVVVGAGAWLGQGAWKRASVSELRSQNRSLRARLRSADRTVNRLAAELNRMATQEQRFRVLAGLPPLDPELRGVGVGGPVAPAAGSSPAPSGSGGSAASRSVPASPSLGRLRRRADLLRTSLREAADSMAAHRERFLALPSIRPVPEGVSWISSGFSHSRRHPVLQVNRPHTGVDLSAPRGTPILATANGRVVQAGRESGYGKVVEIDHGYGFRTLYGHAAAITVRRGQRVERGDRIGRVGETGLTSGPNLHYEVHVDGRPVDPRGYFVEARVPQ